MGSLERMRLGTRRQPGYGLVLLAIVLAIAILAAAGDVGAGYFLALSMLGAALVLALRMAQVSIVAQRWAAVIVGVAVLGAVATVMTSRSPTGFEDALILVLVGTTPVVLARRLVQNPELVGQPLMGALSVYLLIGLFFAYAFALTSALTGRPFFASTTDAGPADYLYFSFASLTTVGYGDFVARSTLGRMFSVSEALTGQAYLVTVVALLVGNLRRRTSNHDC